MKSLTKVPSLTDTTECPLIFRSPIVNDAHYKNNFVNATALLT